MTRIKTETDKELDELQSPDEWEWDDPQRVDIPQEHRRVVVSVSLRRDQSKIIGEAAERSGEKVSEFIRNAALERAKGGNQLNIYRVRLSGLDFSGSNVRERVIRGRIGARELCGTLS